MKSLLVLVSLLLTLGLSAGEKNGVKMADKITVDGKELVLNGMALRKVIKFGFPIKVYVAGLYLEKKSSNAEEIIKSPGIKYLVMEFVRAVDRKQITPAWSKAIKENCFDDCGKHKKETKEFNKLNVNIRKGNQMQVTFYPDKVRLKTTGPNEKQGEVMGASFSRNLLAVFIHDRKPIDKKFIKNMLGLK